MARFAVCIPVYNGADFLEQALESVAMQTLENVEVIVSDNASTDATPEILVRWADRLNMRVIRRPKTLPMREHFNALLDDVDTEFYMLLCHDDYLASPQSLALAHAALTEHSDVGTVYCDLTYVNVNRKKLAGRSFARKGYFDGDVTGIKSIRTARNQFGIPLGVRRSILENHRYAPEFHYTMDLDLSWQLSKVAATFHLAEPLIANRYGTTNTTWALLSGAQREYYKLTNKYNIRMSWLDRVHFMLTNFSVTQQKRIFGLYGRLVTWIG